MSPLRKVIPIVFQSELLRNLEITMVTKFVLSNLLEQTQRWKRQKNCVGIKRSGTRISYFFEHTAFKVIIVTLVVSVQQAKHVFFPVVGQMVFADDTQVGNRY